MYLDLLHRRVLLLFPSHDVLSAHRWLVYTEPVQRTTGASFLHCPESSLTQQLLFTFRFSFSHSHSPISADYLNQYTPMLHTHAALDSQMITPCLLACTNTRT